MRDIVLELLSSYGYAGMFALILIENLFPPIPSEVILTFGGFMTTYTRMNIAGAVLRLILEGWADRLAAAVDTAARTCHDFNEIIVAFAAFHRLNEASGLS